ncbi:MAG: nucleotidyltransferase domain-containing protein [Candidatus Symbiobacter sp.]|nr:nucleotidyltransferase domain-containing protein [Candidatus Symbiobacter sp.]
MTALALADAEQKIVRDILQAHVPKRTVWAFGSRVTGKARRHSDLDLAIMGDAPLPDAIRIDLAEDFTQSDLAFTVDLVDWAVTSEKFRQIIARDKILVQSAS